MPSPATTASTTISCCRSPRPERVFTTNRPRGRPPSPPSPRRHLDPLVSVEVVEKLGQIGREYPAADSPLGERSCTTSLPFIGQRRGDLRTDESSADHCKPLLLLGKRGDSCNRPKSKVEHRIGVGREGAAACRPWPEATSHSDRPFLDRRGRIFAMDRAPPPCGPGEVRSRGRRSFARCFPAVCSLQRPFDSGGRS